ncbi:HAMP domain-containing histidine kinase [Paenibacillus sp. ACRRX]|uniref:sensor histidine kinase n=1 Tax=Paenibacillus sp. ACRRX TaxID=2918206 RepID=UPI001EF60500|nr:HAMP domain-containing sensor histidine kinase [Paenibacillus sp. ACRRX]MCG7409693.1 HAMP domain-containing histidine kinase [Paenibacillus sp. ACRRX]
MNLIRKCSVLVIVLILLGGIFAPLKSSAGTPPDEIRLKTWKVLWEKEIKEWDEISKGNHSWETINIEQGLPDVPEGVRSAWYRVDLPKLSWGQPGLGIYKLYGREVQVVSFDGKTLYNSVRQFGLDQYRLLLPIPSQQDGQSLFIHVKTPDDRIGIQESMLLGNYQEMFPNYVGSGLTNILLACSMILMALVMLFCSVLLRNAYFSSWITLAVIVLSFGFLILGYTDFVLVILPGYETALDMVFGAALISLMLALSVYFEKLVGSGPFLIIRRYRHLLVVYSLLFITFQLCNAFVSSEYFNSYIFSLDIYGMLLVIQLALLLIISIVYSVKKNFDAILFIIGYAIFSIPFIGELVWFILKEGQYDLVYWKWGILGFEFVLIIMLGRRIANNHERVIRYSKELEMYNNELQHSEKMEIISELAASVAHEVRNPLQVTRGFMQLLNHRSGPKEKEYLDMALIELDRAANIITDFLTFAKPELHEVILLDLGAELRHIESILVPLANMQGGQLKLHIEEDVFIYGNSSKFKQAFINMVKNSIESITVKGLVIISAHKKGNKVFVHIKDDGCGMTEKELARLGEPYYSNKSKGTGLGLMVTFRIIEVMQGKIKFTSKKGIGTEVMVEFPYGELNNPPIPV